MAKKKKVEENKKVLVFPTLEDGSIVIRISEDGRLKGSDEIVLQNLLIKYRLDFNEISRLTSLPVYNIVRIYAKYQPYIDKLIKQDNSDEEENNAIQMCLELLIGHISELVKKHREENQNLLRDSEINTICRLLDRLIALRDSKTQSFDKTVSTLMTVTAKLSTVELAEAGELKINGASGDNMSQLVDKIYSMIGNNRSSKPTGPVPHISKNTKTGKVTKFPSKVELMHSIPGFGESSYYTYLNSNKTLPEPNNDWKIWTEEEYTKFMENKQNEKK